MSYTVEKTDTNQVKLTITVPAEEFSAAMQSAYIKLRGRIHINGFRPGKAPRAVIERQYGEEIFYEDAVDALMPKAYDAAVEESGIYPVDQPRVDFTQIGSGKDFIFTCDVTVKPEVTLGLYKGLEVVKPAHVVTDADVDAEIERSRQRLARWNVAERPVETGDQIRLDYAGTVDGVPFEGGTAENQTLEIGSGRFIPGFEEQLVGAAAGEEKDVEVTFPEEYHAPELAGKAAVFHCKILEVKAKSLPELDDEFAKDVSEFETLEEYKADIRATQEKQASQRNENELETVLVEAAVANARMEIPDCMVEHQIDNMLREMQYQMSYQGLKLEDYLKYTGTTMEQLREQNKEEALRRVKAQLVLEAIQKTEGLEASEEELERELAEIATEARPVEKIREEMAPADKDYFNGRILLKKTLALLKDTAVYIQEKDKVEK
ncbi:MAG: trigger factor [Christensenellales bacterium]